MIMSSPEELRCAADTLRLKASVRNMFAKTRTGLCEGMWTSGHNGGRGPREQRHQTKNKWDSRIAGVNDYAPKIDLHRGNDTLLAWMMFGDRGGFREQPIQ